MRYMHIKKIPLPLGEGWVRVEGLVPPLPVNSTLTQLAPLAGLSQSERHVLFAIVVVPITAGSLADLVRQEIPDGRLIRMEKNISILNTSSNGLIWVFVLVIAVTMIFKSGGTIDVSSKGNSFDPNFFPVQAVTWLNSHPQHGHMFNEFDWGGYLLLNLSPRQKIFMDGHTHIYGEALTREYETVQTRGNGWLDIFDKYSITWAIIHPQGLLASELLSAGWEPIYQDQTAIILLKK